MATSDGNRGNGRSSEPTAIVVSTQSTASLLRDHPDLAEAAGHYASAAVPENTARARDSDWRLFSAWCEAHGANLLPATPETVGAFISDQSMGAEDRRPKAVKTIVRLMATIAFRHRSAGYPDPTKHEGVKRIMRGIQRTRGTNPIGQKKALTVDMIRAAMPDGDSLPEVRDRALLLFGLGTAMRRSEIVSIAVDNLRWVEEGVIVDLPRSKTDQLGAGAQKALPKVDDASICPVTALRRWLDESGIKSGPLFRGFYKGGKVRPHALAASHVSVVVKRAAAKIGLDETAFGGHSLRIGFVTSARERGIDWTTIMEQTGHKTLSVAKAYSRHTPGVFEATKVHSVFAKSSR